jgi:hypothetical protein
VVKKFEDNRNSEEIESQLNSIPQEFTKINGNLTELFPEDYRKFPVVNENGFYLYPPNESEETFMIRKNMFDNFYNQLSELLKNFYILEKKIQSLLKIIIIMMVIYLLNQ